MEIIKNLKEINKDVLDYYRSNIEKAKEDYKILTTNNRGLNKKDHSDYLEKHHIKPKCLGGSNDESNYVLLTYDEHILAHMLLYIIYPEEKKIKFAFSAMINMINLKQSGVVVSLDTLVSLRKDFSRNFSENNPTKTEEAIKKQAQSISGNNNPSKRPEVKNKISLKMKGESNPMKKENIRNKLKTRIQGPGGIVYNSISEAAEILGTSRTSILNNIKKEKNFKYIDSPRKSHQKILSPDGKIYPSIRSCAKDLKVGKTTIKSWVEKHPEKGFSYLN